MPRNIAAAAALEEVTVVIRQSDLGNPGVARAMWAGAGVALAGAVAWGLLGAYAEMQSWIIAVLVGVGVGWVITRLVDRPTVPLQVAAVLFTLGSVVIGQVLIVAFSLNRFAGVFDLALSWDLYREGISAGDLTQDLLFGLGGGAIGAFYSVRMLRSKRAAPQPSVPGGIEEPPPTAPPS